MGVSNGTFSVCRGRGKRESPDESKMAAMENSLEIRKNKIIGSCGYVAFDIIALNFPVDFCN